MITLPLNLEYQIARRLPSDINEHLELLKSLADSVEHVTEMGTRTGISLSLIHISEPTRQP